VTKLPNQKIRPKNQLSSKQAVIFGSAFAVAGAVILIATHAAGFTTSFEAENSTKSSPATAVSDASASGGSALKFAAAGGSSSCPLPKYPDGTCTGTPAGVTLHSCPSTITSAGTYDSCNFTGGLIIKNVCKNTVTITRSLITGQVLIQGPNGYEYTPGNLGPNASCDSTGAIISDSTFNCGCMSQGTNDTPTIIAGLDFTLLRDNIYNGGHGVAPDEFVTIQDSYIHGLGGNTDAHKDGFFVGDGDHMLFKHNTVECADGSLRGCTSAIGLLDDFSDTTFITIDSNLLASNGAACFYGSGGPQKNFSSNNLTFTNNHFSRKFNPGCGWDSPPVNYWDSTKPGMVWSNNVWDDTGQVVPPSY
jgi:hypothetical protein